MINRCRDDDDGSNLLHFSDQGNTQCVSLFLAKHANVNMVDEDGLTALMLASNNGHEEIVSILMENSTEPAKRA